MTDRRMLWIGVGNSHERAASPGRAEHGRKFPNARRIKAMKVPTLLRIE
jgi:hypothetical protein